MPTTASERSLKDLRAAKMHTAADLVCAFPEEHWRRVRTTDEIDKPFLLDLLFWRSTGDRVAKSRPEDVSPTAQPSPSLLIGGTRAPFFQDDAAAIG